MSGGKAKRKGKGQGDPGAAMAYLRRLHGSDPDPAPVADLAELAERKQTPDAGQEKNNNWRQAQ